MTKTTWGFLEEYRNADITKRLHLYLQYPDLRSEFAQVEKNESAHGQPSSKPGRSGIQMACKVRTWPLFQLMPWLDRRCCH